MVIKANSDLSQFYLANIGVMGNVIPSLNKTMPGS
jgi:hypothetical protein